jgi:phosphoribosylformylglycinamidine synthase
MNYKTVGLRKEEYLAIKKMLGREPNESELRILGVMWSEHCSYKSTRSILKMFNSEGKHVIQGPGENAGIVDIGGGWAAAFKVESHNHPSAVEPYQGAATGVGGIIRDILAVGAWPTACLDGLFFGKTPNNSTLSLIEGVVAGIGGYGNAVGVPTVGGKTFFDDSYEGNPLVNAMCVGTVHQESVITSRTAKVGQWVVLLGSRTGRDGIAGAAFASTELAEDTKSSKPQVQIGDPFVEKLLIECCHELLKDKLIASMQDMGAAGITSSASEIAAKSGTGIHIYAEKVPTREANMTPWEIALSESQERMLLIIEPDNFDKVKKCAEKWLLECALIGEITSDKRFRITNHGETVVDLPAEMVGGGCPVIDWPSQKPAYLENIKVEKKYEVPQERFKELFLSVLTDPNVRDKSWIYEQYDHMVQTNTVAGPGNPVSVIRIKENGTFLALSMDCDPWSCWLDPYNGGAESFLKAARPLWACGAEVLGMTDCLNYPSPESPENYWVLKESVRGLAQAAKDLECPVVSGNVSLYNESPGKKILPSPLVGIVGLLRDLDTFLPSGRMEAKDILFLVGPEKGSLAGSLFQRIMDGTIQGKPTPYDADLERKFKERAIKTSKEKCCSSVRVIGSGGLAISIAKECIFAQKGARINIAPELLKRPEFLFGEGGPRAIYSVKPSMVSLFESIWRDFGLLKIGTVIEDHTLDISGLANFTLQEILGCWRG